MADEVVTDQGNAAQVVVGDTPAPEQEVGAAGKDVINTFEPSSEASAEVNDPSPSLPFPETGNAAVHNPIPEPAQSVAGGGVADAGTELQAGTTDSNLLADDFDVICSDERDLLGNFLVRDLIYHHGTRADGDGGGPRGRGSTARKSVADIADRIVSTVRGGVAFSVAGEGRYGGGRFLDRVEDGGTKDAAAPGPTYRELGPEEAKAYISKVFETAFPQPVNVHVSADALGEKLKQGDGEEHAQNDVTGVKDDQEKSGSAHLALSSANDGDVFLLNSSLSYPSDDVYASHPGNKRFIEFLNGASSGLESSGLDSSPGAATARAQLFLSSVNFVRGSGGKGRFLAQKSHDEGWAALDDELAILETVTVLLWRKFLERERQKLLSPPPPPAPAPALAPAPADKTQPPVVAPPAAVVAPPAAAKADAPPRKMVRVPRESQQYCRWPADYQVIPPSDIPIARPTDHDVLFGRGGLTNHHPGNKRFRDIIAVHRADYVDAIKIEKPNVARKIVRAIRCGVPAGRFLKKSAKDGMWYDVGDRHAAEKASQALREKSQAEKYEKVAAKKQAEAALRDSQIATSTAPYGTMVMPPLTGSTAPPAVTTTSWPPPGQTMYSPPPGQGVPPPPVGMEVTGENGAGTKRKPAPAKEAGNAAKKIKASTGESSPAEVYTPIDEYGNIVVTDHDILCGRGGLTNHHLGNKRFRDIVSLHRPDYIRAPKIEKPSVARMIVSAIRNGNPPGRFLKKDSVSGKWFDVGDKRAAEKASQALREKTPEERLKLAARFDRPMPTRQYFSPTGTHIPEMPHVSGTKSAGTVSEPKDGTAPQTTRSPTKGGKDEAVAEV